MLTQRGQTGIDFIFPDEFAEQFGRAYIEIKPNSPSAQRKYKSQMADWGYDPSTVAVVTYDAKSVLRWGWDLPK